MEIIMFGLVPFLIIIMVNMEIIMFGLVPFLIIIMVEMKNG